MFKCFNKQVAQICPLQQIYLLKQNFLFRIETVAKRKRLKSRPINSAQRLRENSYQRTKIMPKMPLHLACSHSVSVEAFQSATNGTTIPFETLKVMTISIRFLYSLECRQVNEDKQCQCQCHYTSAGNIFRILQMEFLFPIHLFLFLFLILCECVRWQTSTRK